MWTTSDRGDGDLFGWSVAVDGDTAVVGAPTQASFTGAVYVFTKPENGWDNMTQTAKLAAFDGGHSDLLGASVAVDGDTIVVGAYGWDDDANDVDDTGSVYVFTKPSGGWDAWDGLSNNAKRNLTASDAADDEFGCSVALDGDTVVEGADWDDDNGDQPCSVYLFTKPSGGWDDANETAKLTAPDGAENDEFGFSVAAGGAVGNSRGSRERQRNRRRLRVQHPPK